MRPRNSAWGSSPLTRGALRSLYPSRGGCVAHPRSRGEHLMSLFLIEIPYGSSPLTRGALQLLVRPFADARLIPAHAGSTWWGSACAPRVRAHPRSRGEHASTFKVTVCASGSSPLTRGALLPPGAAPYRRGLIPAHAGSTVVGQGLCWASRAHPRSRGEHNLVDTNTNYAVGSSPLTRGAHCVLDGGVNSCGLIPAHAGSTPCVG